MLTLGPHAVREVSGCVFYDLMTLSYTELEHVQSASVHVNRVGVINKPQAC